MTRLLSPPAHKRILAAALAAFLVAPALAQDSAANPDRTDAASSDIVVSGLREKDRNKAVDGFAKDLTRSDTVSPMAFYEPGDFCAGVAGLSAATNAAIAARMHAVASAASIEPGDPGACQTSALVVFVDDTQQAISRFRALKPEYFLELTGETIFFHGMNTPVAGWKLHARVDNNGNPVGVDEDGIQHVEVMTSMSRLQSGTRVVTAMSVLVIEKAAVLGLSTQQIADYALMRAVTDTDPVSMRSANVPTILAVLDSAMGEETPLSLTQWDLAYVQARYSVNRINYGVRQAADIRRRMKRSLTAEAFGAARESQ